MRFTERHDWYYPEQRNSSSGQLCWSHKNAHAHSRETYLRDWCWNCYRTLSSIGYRQYSPQEPPWRYPSVAVRIALVPFISEILVWSKCGDYFLLESKIRLLNNTADNAQTRILRIRPMVKVQIKKYSLSRRALDKFLADAVISMNYFLFFLIPSTLLLTLTIFMHSLSLFSKILLLTRTFAICLFS